MRLQIDHIEYMETSTGWACAVYACGIWQRAEGVSKAQASKRAASLLKWDLEKRSLRSQRAEYLKCNN